MPNSSYVGAEPLATDDRGRPDPSKPITQLLYLADFSARFLGFLGVGGVPKLAAAVASGDIPAVLTALAGSKDPDVARFGGVIQAYSSAGKAAQPLGYTATIVIANTEAGKPDWKPDPLYWGTPGG